jgi:hypothetical protein
VAQPLIATDRIRMRYIIDGLSHDMRHYVHVQDSAGVDSTLAHRGGGSGVLWTDDVQFLWDVWRSIFHSGTTSADVLLEHKDGDVWNPIAGYTATGAGSQSVYNKAQQTTIVLRDQFFNKLRIVGLESNQGYAGHDVDGSGLTTALSNIVLAYTTSTDTNAMYNWIRSRSDILVANTGGAVGVTLDSNNKIRRARGLV